MKTNENVYDVIKHDERFTILAEILEVTGIGEAMSHESDTFTFFAPTDDAFRRLSAKAVTLLTSPEGSALVGAILGQHLIPKSYLYSDDLRRRKSVKTLFGYELRITEEENSLQLEEAHILTPGIAASNAVIFPIDKVLPARAKIASAMMMNKHKFGAGKTICRKPGI
jgi:uncharacterized surface protein with fasciclin (FAS1) repeats